MAVSCTDGTTFPAWRTKDVATGVCCTVKDTTKDTRTLTFLGSSWSEVRFLLRFLVDYLQNFAKTGHGPHFPLFCLIVMYVPFSEFCVLFVCECVLYYCHRVTTQLQLNRNYYYYYYYYLTAIGLSPGGSNTVHIYTQTIHRIQRTEQT
jgi:hypothetical protein